MSDLGAWFYLNHWGNQMRMNRALTESIRMERFEEIYDDYQSSKRSCEEAAMILGCSNRHFLRLRDRYEEDGLGGLKDRRVGRGAKRRGAGAGGKGITALYCGGDEGVHGGA